MPTIKYHKPRLPGHYYVLFEPPDGKGEEVLRFVSERKKIDPEGALWNSVVTSTGQPRDMR